MKTYKEIDLVKGWFVGNFDPSCFKTDSCEVAVKRYKANDYEKSHYHKIATEITFIVNGSVLMNNKEYNAGDIILIEPNESTDFLAVTDTSTIVVKVPCCKNDKYENI
jgi:quercetin dioxygenase-like cupin family protein